VARLTRKASECQLPVSEVGGTAVWNGSASALSEE
jgi:hypothetical protein